MDSHSSDNSAPLRGLNVVELSAIGPVPFVGLQLQQLGASVTRVLPPSDRAIGIDMDSRADILNTGKAIERLDLKSKNGQQSLDALLAETDVLIEGFRPGVLERLGMAPERLLKHNPKLVIGRLSGFGQRGNYAKRAGHDINYLALSGVLSSIGSSDKPVIPLNLIADFGGGAMYLLAGILAKLVQRGISGLGGEVKTSILAGTVGLTTMTHGLMADNQWSLQRESNLLDGGAPFYAVYKTRDNKFIAIGALEKVFYKELLEILGLSDVLPLDSQYDAASWPEMRRLFIEAFASRSRDDWAAIGTKRDCCLTPVLNFEESVNLPHNTANGWILDEPFKHPGPVIQF